MEEFASRSYLNMGLWADQAGYGGTAQYFYDQAEEERGHMKKFIKFILETGNKPVISDYGEALPDANSFESLFEIALGHEKAVTESIHSMVELAWENKDYPTFNFLQWFVAEQVEEENQFQTILDKIDIVKKHGGSYYMLDRELAARAKS
jgi:ferritin